MCESVCVTEKESERKEEGEKADQWLLFKIILRIVSCFTTQRVMSKLQIIYIF